MTACSHCNCYCRPSDTTCPHCGAALSRGAGRPQRAAAAVLLGLALSGCPDKSKDSATGTSPVALYGMPDTGAQAEYGVPDTSAYADADADGWTPAEGDCDDSDDRVHPEATETPADGLDSNCNGDDDT